MARTITTPRRRKGKKTYELKTKLQAAKKKKIITEKLVVVEYIKKEEE